MNNINIIVYIKKKKLVTKLSVLKVIDFTYNALTKSRASFYLKHLRRLNFK